MDCISIQSSLQARFASRRTGAARRARRCAQPSTAAAADDGSLGRRVARLRQPAPPPGMDTGCLRRPRCATDWRAVQSPAPESDPGQGLGAQRRFRMDPEMSRIATTSPHGSGSTWVRRAQGRRTIFAVGCDARTSPDEVTRAGRSSTAPLAWQQEGEWVGAASRRGPPPRAASDNLQARVPPGCISRDVHRVHHIATTRTAGGHPVAIWRRTIHA